jgi:SAM-dependent methyltransferase
MLSRVIRVYKKYQVSKAQQLKVLERKIYINNGQIPWSPGYLDYRNEQIDKAINNAATLQHFVVKSIPQNFGYKLDERIVEYCWIFSQMPNDKIRLLDAGSTFNYNFIVNHQSIVQKDLTILTYAPEKPNFNENRISYLYADLRDIPLRDEYFDMVVSQSTIEHIDMDNSIYGYDIAHTKEEKKSYEYLKAVQEMERVLKKGGILLMTFPYGKFEHHGFFQQFDAEMLDKLLNLLKDKGNCELSFFRYLPHGWAFCSKDDCKNIESFNPHTGRGKGSDGAAHSRAICCVKFIKQA